MAIEMRVGDTTRLALACYDSAGNPLVAVPMAVSWKTRSDPAHVSLAVEDGGRTAAVTALSPGDETIEANVIADGAPFAPVFAVTVAPRVAEIHIEQVPA